MTQPAHVTSIEALATFRAQLIVYLEKASSAVNDVSDDMIRTRLWLQNDQRSHWEAQIQQRTRDLETAQQELFSARMSGLREASALQQMALAEAKRALAEAQQKLASVKRWNRRYEDEVEPLAKQVERLRDLLSGELRKATAFLARAVKALEAYADRAPSAGSVTPPQTPPLPAGESSPEGLRLGDEAAGAGSPVES
jgi:predicted  nucleic acid-binding Zn-ribbon protein